MNMEKRAFTRREVRLEGICSAPGKGSRTVEIRDFCTGGMLLAYSDSTNPADFSPEHGDIVDVRCHVPGMRGTRALTFNGRIVRVESGTAGLAFIDPDSEAVHLVHDFVKKAAAPTSPQDEKTPRVASPAVNALLLECRSLVDAALAPIIDEFLHQAVDRLYVKAGAAQSIIDKNGFYDALAAFNKRGDVFKIDFITRMRQRIASNKPVQNAATESARNPKLQKLSLVDDDVFEEWLVFSDTARKVELEHQESLTDLGLRLSVIYAQEIDNESNPYAPASFTHAFKLALTGFTLTPNAARVVYSSFRDVLTARIGALYDQLNSALVEHGVFVDIEQKYRLPSIKQAAARSDKPNVAAVKPAAAAPGINTPAAQNPPPPQDWYQLVQELEQLKQQVTALPTHDTPAALAPPPSAPLGQLHETGEVSYVASEDLLAALSKIPTPQADSNGGHPSIKSQMLTLLAQQRPRDEKFQIPAREEKVIDVTETLLDSVLNDKLVAGSVTPWLRQLSIPLLKTAIRDESVFSDRTHYTRQIINAVAELEFYGDDSGGQNAVSRKIQALLQEIESADDLSPELFQRVLRELNALIRIQHKAYQENVQEVVLLEQSKPLAANGVTPYRPAEDATAAEWHKRIRRLKVGNSVMLDTDSTPRRLKIAWIGKNFDRYVFVNVKGLKEQVLNSEELVHRLRTGSAIVLDDGGEPLVDRAQYSMLQKMHRHLLHETTHDQLTGLINRREFEHLLTEALADVRQHESRHILCHLDLTQFNVVNSTFGYDGGDRVLVEVAELLERGLGTQATLGRIGGDEFAVLLMHTSVEDALALMDGIKLMFSDYRYTQNQQSLALSFSAGLVPLVAESSSAADVFQSAETSAHVARSKGTNYTKVFNADDTGLHRQQQVTKWVTRIDTALDSESLDLRYQPIVGIANGDLQIHHSEILLGVRDEQGNPVSPAEFILAAEHFRRMAAVDRWVIEHAFRWLVENPHRLPLIGGVAINLSGSSLNEEGFVGFILEQAKQLAVPMDKVCFEITETAGIENLSNASEFILAVKETGCMFSLDDFGSGHSSYAYLKNLPVDFLKIDGAFVRHMDENPYDYAVVKSITEIGHFMGKKIIAEFVENEGILKMLREIGVDFAQGYVIAKPQSLKTLQGEDLPAFL